MLRIVVDTDAEKGMISPRGECHRAFKAAKVLPFQNQERSS